MYRFWMDGIYAQNLVEVRSDFQALEEPGFWAVVGTFEGEFTFARFDSVSHQPFSDEAFNGHEISRHEIGEWKSSLDRSEYLAYVEKIREHIADGWVYQVNACRTLTAPLKGSLSSLMQELLVSNPAPHAMYLNLPTMEIASASPELFLKVSINESGERIALTSPIKGTSATPEFLEKDLAENVMIVDLMRNDLASISIPGTTKVPRLLGTEAHPGLYHLVSDVSSTLEPDRTWQEILCALMPPGSVSGAPKSSAKSVIAGNESARGPYCGALGWIHNGQAHLAVGIRTFWQHHDGLIHFGTGAGITWGSSAANEWEETELKALRLMAIAEGRYARTR